MHFSDVLRGASKLALAADIAARGDTLQDIPDSHGVHAKWERLKAKTKSIMSRYTAQQLLAAEQIADTFNVFAFRRSLAICTWIGHHAWHRASRSSGVVICVPMFAPSDVLVRDCVVFLSVGETPDSPSARSKVSADEIRNRFTTEKRLKLARDNPNLAASLSKKNVMRKPSVWKHPGRAHTHRSPGPTFRVPSHSSLATTTSGDSGGSTLQSRVGARSPVSVPTRSPRPFMAVPVPSTNSQMRRGVWSSTQSLDRHPR